MRSLQALIFLLSCCPFLLAQAPRKIICYFTQPVDTSVSTGVNAVYLNNTADDTLVQYINRAQYSIDICIYNTTSSGSVANIAGALNNAYASGKRVRVIYEGSTGNTMIPNLNANINRLASPQGTPYNIMHNKFVVFDADAPDPGLPIVWTGSMNWTTTQINGTDANNIVIIQDQLLAQAYQKEFEEMWGDTGLVPNAGLARFGPMKTNNTQHVFIIEGKIVECYFSPSDSVNQRILTAIGSADTDLEFASMVITRNDISSAIVNNVSNGVLPTYGLVDDSVTTTEWGALVAGMLPNTMKSASGQPGIMHHKFLIADQSNVVSDPLVLTGSHNWSTSANNQNDENTLIIHDDTIANLYFQHFAWLYAQMGGVMSAGTPAENTGANVYPNPFADRLVVQADGAGELTLYNSVGAKAGCWDLKPGGNEIRTDLLPGGIYFFLIESGAGIRTGRLIRQ
ncbi:MAG: phospholipase D-like domain-containing protein [Bacteroidota bacterium]